MEKLPAAAAAAAGGDSGDEEEEEELFYLGRLPNIFCGFDFYLKSLMRPGDLHPFIQGNRHIQTIFCCCF